MEYLSLKEFGKYMVSHDVKYTYNERYDLAYRTITENLVIVHVFRKHRGTPEMEIPYDDEDYTCCWDMGIIMTKEEYENF